MRGHATSKSGRARQWPRGRIDLRRSSGRSGSGPGSGPIGSVGTKGGRSCRCGGGVSCRGPSRLRCVSRSTPRAVCRLRGHPLRARWAQSGRDRRPRRDPSDHGHLPRRPARGRARHPGAESTRVPPPDGPVRARPASVDRITAVVRRQADPRDPADGRGRVLPVDPRALHGPTRRRSRQALSDLVPLPGRPRHPRVDRARGGGRACSCVPREPGAEWQRWCSWWRWPCSPPRRTPSPRPSTPRTS